MNRKSTLLIIYILGGGLLTLSQRYLTFYFDNFTLNFYRFFSGTMALLVVVLMLYRQDLQQVLRSPATLLKILAFSAVLLIPQYLLIEGLARTSAVMGGLVGALGIPLTVLLTVIVFPEEKNIIRNKWVQFGSLLAFGGTIGVTLSKGPVAHGYSLGVLFLVAAMILGSLCYLMIKKMVGSVEPFNLALFSSACMCLVFLAGSLAWGNPAHVAELPLWPVAVLFFSGVIGLLVCNGLALLIIKKFGIIVTRFSELAMPVVTGVCGFIFLSERLNIYEGLFAVLVLVGCALIIGKDKNLDHL